MNLIDAKQNMWDVSRFLTLEEVVVVTEYIQRTLDARTKGVAWVDPYDETGQSPMHKFFGRIPPVDPELKALTDKL